MTVRLLCTYAGPGTEWLPPGWVALLRGERARPAGGGLVHRSPDSDAPRLVLVIDPIHEEHA